MVLKSTLSQTSSLLKKKGAVCVFFLLLVMVLSNFINNVIYFQGTDIVEMYHPTNLLLLSYDRTNFDATTLFLLIQLYPLLVVCPAGFSLAKEYQHGTHIYMISRLGGIRYQISRYLSAFFATMIVFTIPFLLEILLNCMSFPLSADGNLANLSVYSSYYRDSVNLYSMKNLYLHSPFAYAIIGTILFGIVSGLLGMFTVAISSLIKIKYNVFLFLPVFLSLSFCTILANRFPKDSPSIRWYDYLLLFNDKIKNITGWFIGLLILTFILIGTACISGRKDCL